MLAPLTLARDARISAPTLAQHLGKWAGGNDARVALARLLYALTQGSIPLAGRLAQGHLTGDPTAVVGTNESGDTQKALNLAAHDHFIALFAIFPAGATFLRPGREMIAAAGR
ncbi:hypothetical protein [Antarctobacter heliothermus]|uniref:Fructose-1,6-bisphosphatase I n=1 Tax=Antarctobacter heliothermus TaxID=74033 RepID=A0A239CXA7_9RHOB|nr:hypothetical protein [Antarctobacter heliothermus]SNS24886.1 fructose-1,6-bisphosphatase I [Antarctobacter heliothermus]